jgi:hypothetical protein
MRCIVLVGLGNVLGPNNPDCLVVLCSALATENTDDITHRLFRKELEERREIPAHVSDPAIPEGRLSRRAFRLQALPFSDSDSIATLRVFEAYRIFDSMPMFFYLCRSHHVTHILFCRLQSSQIHSDDAAFLGPRYLWGGDDRKYRMSVSCVVMFMTHFVS